MFRSAATTKMGNDLDNDENYEFSGATLKISSNETVYVNKTTTEDTTKAMENSTSTVQPQSESRISPPASETDSSTAKPKIGSPRHFFSFRSGQFEKAVDDIVTILLRPANDIDLLGKWLLTEISHWDHERERVIILTTKTLLIVKYDFIALRILEHNKIRLTQIDTIIKGKLKYPETSLVPRLKGITNGVTSIVEGSFFAASNDPKPIQNRNLALVNRFDFSSFKPVVRDEDGLRIMWNKGQPISFLTSWNPFATDIPWVTIKDHPLFNYQDQFNTPLVQEDLDKNRQCYSVENFYEVLFRIFSDNKATENAEVNYSCLFQYEPIIMQNYVGVGAVIHNKNNFGFFKVRGKFSF